jgi:hypothetical protein
MQEFACAIERAFSASVWSFQIFFHGKKVRKKKEDAGKAMRSMGKPKTLSKAPCLLLERDAFKMKDMLLISKTAE